MKWYGSLNNRIQERGLSSIPTVGMGATFIMYSDREPYTITEVSSEKIAVQVNQCIKGEIKPFTNMYPKYIMAVEDAWKVVEGSMQDGSAKYIYLPGGGPAEKFIFHKPTKTYRKETTTWVPDSSDKFMGGYLKGTNRTNKGQQVLSVGRREKWYDPSF